MATPSGPPRSFKESKDLWAVNPAYDFELALELERAWRAETGVAGPNAVIVGKRHLLMSTAWARCGADGDWLDDSALCLAARLRPSDGGRTSQDGKADIKKPFGRAASAIEIALNRDKPRSLAHQENDQRLMDAIEVFATPGAMAYGYRNGLAFKERRFCTEWFSDNRDLVLVLGARVGTAGLFDKVRADPAAFYAEHLGRRRNPVHQPGFGRERM